jgi:hypothetical protein
VLQGLVKALRVAPGEQAAAALQVLRQRLAADAAHDPRCISAGVGVGID